MSAFDDLQRQLHDAVAARATAPARRLRAFKWPRSLVLVFALLVSVGGVAAAAVRLLGGDNAPSSAVALVGRITASTLHTKACQIVSTGYRAQLAAGHPSASLRAKWAFLRRPGAERLPSEILEKPFAGPTEILSASVRHLKSADGTRWWAFVARASRHPASPQPRDPDACRRLRRKRLTELAHDVKPEIVALAEKILTAQNRPNRTGGHVEQQVYGFAYSRAGTTANTTYSGPYTSSLAFAFRLARSQGRPRQYLTGLLPDDVAQVLLKMRGPAFPARTRVVTTRDNTYSAAVPPGVTDISVTLRTASGHTLSSTRMAVSSFSGR